MTDEADDDGDDDLDGALAEARPEDPAALALARAKVAAALFGDLAPGFGRFRVLDRLGRGGMGVVYAAYDPELDRGVALKMIDVSASDREAALAEAKALARLAHPNVVGVFDVGVQDERVYIVMELVRGTPLRAWASERSTTEIVDAYRQAGAGLAAAHAAGLVHRDVKPDNLIVGDDGRVRVVDFGLACEAGARDASGTPRYMAPEQRAGEVTAATDQYSFCVSLRESLPTVPAWIEALLTRGTAEDPAARFSTLDELVRALGRDPSRVLRRRIAVGVGIACVAGLVAIARSSAATEPCSGGSETIAAAWPTRGADLARLAQLGDYGRELAARYPAELARYTQRWVAQQRGACEEHRRGVASTTMFDRRSVCLARVRAAYGEAGRVTSTATQKALPDVALAIAALPSPEACGDIAQLSATGDPPPAAAAQLAPVREAIERARVLVAAGRGSDARALLQPAITSARAIAYRPVLAESLLVAGHAAMTEEDHAGAISALREATREALTAGASAIAVEAWARRAWTEGMDTAGVRALDGLDVIEPLAATATPFARALLHNNAGSVELARGRRSEAQRRFADAAREAQGVRDVELSAIASNTVLASADPTREDAQLARMITQLTETLGAQHPQVVQLRLLRATTTQLDDRAALVELISACPTETLPAAVAAQCWWELALMHADAGDARAASAAMTHVPDDISIAASGYRALWAGTTATFAVPPLAPDEPWYERYERALSVLGIARATSSGERYAEAAALFERVLVDSPAMAVRRRLAAARARR